MALGLKGTVAEDVLQAILDNTAYTGPADTYIKLHTGGPGAAGTNNAATETTRKLVAWTIAFAVAANTSTLTWTTVAGTETYTNFSLWDASTAGNFLLSGSITATAITAGATFTIAAGNLTVLFNVAG